MIMIDKFDGQYRFLSNFYPCTIEYEGILYPSVEHAYQAAKTFDVRQKARIALAVTPGKAKAMGQGVRMLRGWDDIKVEVMYHLLLLKFQDVNLRVLLKGTGDALLVEGNWWGDAFWGVCKGVGENMLGNLLMLVRSEL